MGRKHEGFCAVLTSLFRQQPIPSINHLRRPPITPASYRQTNAAERFDQTTWLATAGNSPEAALYSFCAPERIRQEARVLNTVSTASQFPASTKPCGEHEVSLNAVNFTSSAMFYW